MNVTEYLSVQMKVFIIILITIFSGILLDLIVHNLYISFIVVFIISSLLIMAANIEVWSGMKVLIVIIFVLIGVVALLFNKIVEGVFIASLIVYLSVIFISMKSR